MAEYAAEWRAAGACATADPGAAAGQIAAAQEVCARCRVRKQCLEFAMRTGEADGIWGGTTPEERIRVRQRRAAARRRRARHAWPNADAPDARASLPPRAALTGQELPAAGEWCLRLQAPL